MLGNVARALEFYGTVLDLRETEQAELRKSIDVLKNQERAFHFVSDKTGAVCHLVCCEQADDGMFLVFLSTHEGYSADIIFDFNAYLFVDGRQTEVAGMSAYFFFDSREICICEICSPCRNQGYGSRLLGILKHVARSHGAKSISGVLSPVDMLDENDSAHSSRLIHFYQKHGFLVSLSKDETSAYARYDCCPAR